MKKTLSKVTCVRCKNCAHVLKTFASNDEESMNQAAYYADLGHKVTVEENGNKPRCAGKVCYEKEGIEQLTLTLS